MAGKAKAPAKKTAKTPVKKAAKPAAKPVAKKAAALKKPLKSAKPAPAKAAAKKAPAKMPAKAPKKAPAKAPVKAPPSAAAKVAKPVAAPAKPAAKPAVAPRPAARPAAARPAAVAVAAPAPAIAPMPAPRALPPRPQPVSQHDVAAAHEYLLSRSATRSEEPVIVNGKKLPTEEQLLRMSEAQYMNEDQLAFFKYRLQQMERELLANADETTEHLRETVIVPDPADRATIEEEHALELRTRDRERKLLKKVQQALTRIDSGDYGFCEETGDPIGIPRLLARPTATLSLEAQQRREMKQKLYGD
jgi:DnaK suppressor protein